jgi:hypothetical protein
VFTPEDLKPGAAGAEAAPTPGSGAPPAANSATTPVPKATPADVAAVMAAISGTGAPASTPNPQIAADVDVIEPEWVAKAEQVVQAHAGDPYGEEEAIEELQQDYLQKRYGINVADSDADNTKPKGA